MPISDETYAILTNQPSLEIQIAVKAKIDWCYETALAARENYKSLANMPWPTVEYKDLANVAGKAYYQTQVIELNTKFLYTEFDDMINDTVPHEWSHLACWHLWGSAVKGHGQLWQMFMTHMGLNPIPCHQYSKDKNDRSLKRYTYHCHCRSVKFDELTHSRSQKGTHFYTCPRCKGEYKYVNTG